MTAKERTVLLRPLASAESLDTLVAEARRFALHCLRAGGKMTPTLLLATEKGLLAFVANSTSNEQAKDQFANECRLMAIATQARMCAMVMETWMASVLPGDDLRTKRASQEPDRIEAVMIVAESRTQPQRTYVQPVIRDRKGRVARLTDSTVPVGIELRGRFAGMLSPNSPSGEESRSAEFLLRAISVHDG